jgi:acetyl-CoA carboxylase carboxyltransferase component/biotin carboxyl carrier protein
VHQADIEVERFDAHSGRIVVNGKRFRLTTAIHGPVHLVEVDSVTHRISLDEGGVVRSPAPALVVATPLAVGDEVEENAPVLVLESMKMETVLRAPFRAQVKECLVSVGSQVEAGAPLLRLEPLADDNNTQDTPALRAASQAAEIDLPAAPLGVPVVERAERLREDLRGLLLGFDGNPADRRRLLADYLAARDELGGQPVPGEPELLTVFADLSELSRNRQGSDTDAEAGSAVHSPREYFHSYLQTLDVERAGITEGFELRLKRMLGHYDVTSLDRSAQLETAVFRIFLAQQQMTGNAEIVSELLRRWLASAPPAEPMREPAGLTLEHLIEATQVRFPAVADLARGVVFRWFAQPLLRRNRARVYAAVRNHLRYLDRNPDAPDRAKRIQAMVASSEPLLRLIGQRIGRHVDHAPLLEVLTRRYYSNRRLADVMARDIAGGRFVTAEYSGAGGVTLMAATATGSARLPEALAGLAELAVQAPAGGLVADLYVTWADQPDADVLAARIMDLLTRSPLSAVAGQIAQITFTVVGTGGTAMQHHFTFRPDGAGLAEDRLIRGLHPQVAERLQLDRLREFDLTRLPSADEEIYLFKAVAKANSADERLIAMGQVRDLTPLREADGRLVALPELENVLTGCLDAIRIAQAQRPQHRRFARNRIMMYVWPASGFTVEELAPLARRIRPSVSGSGTEEVQFVARLRGAAREPIEMAVRVSDDARGRVQIDVGPPPTAPLLPLDDYQQKVLRATRRGNAYPYQLTDLLAGPGGRFTEYDLGDSGALVPVDRPKGMNRAAIVAGVVSTPTKKHPGGVTRVVLLGDPTKSLGALSEPECTRVVAAIDLAERMAVPLEWFSLSSGARISMQSGTENMDWVAAALKRIVEFTQAGGEINIVVAGINVGAQPYWNAEATMLMHTRGILVMTPESAMVLTGKQALDFSGGVSAEDNFGIGGYDRVMGPNGQAQYWAPSLAAACDVLMAHYDHTYVAPGDTAPRRAATSDPKDRDVSGFPHAMAGSDFATIGEIFSVEHNPDRKKPFEIRSVMRALTDQDLPVLERWAGMEDADTSVVQDAHIGGWPVCLIGIESRAVPRRGFPPADGPDTYTAGTLFPLSSKKTARAINGASGNRPLVVLANLSGFDGSPESMRKLQLEYGAEIGRAIVNFDGPIVFCVISRYHGGAFVVFSKALNPSMTVLALEGSFASVLGGAPAAAVVFSGEVSDRTATDSRVADLQARAAETSGAARAALNAELIEVQASVRAEKLGEVAAEFDRIHSIQRAVEVGSVDAIISVQQLRPRIIDAIEHGEMLGRAQAEGG